MKILKVIVLAALALSAVLFAVGLMLPRTWQVEVSVLTEARAEQLYPRVVDLRRWPEWAAWNKEMDPDVVWTYSGPETGLGASWSWKGPVMGTGGMTITRAEPAAGVWVDEKIEGDEVNAHGAITWQPEGAKTRLTWKDEGTLPPVIGGYFKGMIEAMLTGHFQKGLEKLAAAAELEATAAAAELEGTAAAADVEDVAAAAEVEGTAAAAE